MGGKRILVVEDEKIIALDIASKMEKLGYGVSAMVSSGKDAIESVQKDRPDLILMDIVLEGEMDGIQAAVQIRSVFDIPVVYLTAYADEKILERAKATGPFGYVLKPFEAKSLQVAVELAFYKHMIEGELRKAHDELEQLVRDRTSELAKANDQLLSELVEKKHAKTALRKKTEELQLYSNKLQELNAALKVLLQQREEDRTDLEEKVLLNVKYLLTPHFEALKKRNMDHQGKVILEILESNTKSMTSSFAQKLSSKYLNFTPTEIKVANLVKEGKQTKEVAEIMGVSHYAIELHRFNIRKKLDLKSRKINLQSYLSSLS